MIPRNTQFVQEDNAVEWLQGWNAPLPLAEFEQIALTRIYNARMCAPRAIARQGRTAALDGVMALYPNAGRLVEGVAAELASDTRYAAWLRVDVDGEQLTAPSV